MEGRWTRVSVVRLAPYVVSSRRVGGCLLLAAAVVAGMLLSNSSGDDAAIRSVVQRAQQAADDAVYFPVQMDDQWVLSGPKGTWLQSTISSTSSPWRWRTYPCASLDPSLASSMDSFMHRVIDETFTGALASELESMFEQKLARSNSTVCLDPNGGRVAYGPPGPIRDTTIVKGISIDGGTAAVTAQVQVTDWQGGVTQVPAAGGGRRVGWAVVPGLLDSKYSLRLYNGHRWLVTGLSSSFALGHEP
jgi:hypothetical protein